MYTDDINKPGEFGVELHVITFPHGTQEKAYPGEITTDHSLFVSAEISWHKNKRGHIVF